MSGEVPIQNEWQRLGLSWHYIIQPSLTPFRIAPNQLLQIPRPDPVDFQAPEGILINFTAAFDNPLCGIDVEAYPGLTFARSLTVNNLMGGGFANQPWAQNAKVPPNTAPGVFSIELASGGASDWFWRTRLRLYVFNSDPAATHICLGLGYTLAMLDTDSPRPKRPYLNAIEDLKDRLVNLLTR